MDLQRISALAKTVETGILWKLCAESNVLILEDEIGSRRVEKNATLLTGDGEAEWLCDVVESEIAVDRTCSRRRSSEDRVWHLIDLVGFVLDLDMKTVI